MIQHTIDLSKLTPPQVDAYCALVRALAPADSDATRAAATTGEVVTDFTMMGAHEHGRRVLATSEANAEAPTGALPTQGAAGINFSACRGRVSEPEVQFGESATLQNGGEVTLHAGPRPGVNAPTGAPGSTRQTDATLTPDEEHRDPYDSADGAGAPAEVDMHGVPFDAAYCARAATPFYGSGKESGQWKKKVGVNKADYDAWYAAARAALAPAATHSEDADSENGAPFDMGRAFASAAASSTSVAQAAQPQMQTAGEFMRWVSEATVAGTLTQPHIDDAWARLGLGYADIMPPTPPERVAANVQALVAELV